MSKQNDYWRKRIEKEIEAGLKRDTSFEEEVKKIHSFYINELEKEIRAFEQRYADKNAIDIAEVRKRVSAMDVEAFADKAERYVKEKNFSPEANKELAIYNLKMKMNRLELLQYELDLQLVALGNETQGTMQKFLEEEYLATVNSQTGILGETVGNLKANMQAVINTPYHGAKWSETLWKNQKALRGVVSRLAMDTVIRGKNPTTMVSQLRKEFDVSVYAARRLAITEGARIQTAVQKESLTNAGFEEYEYIAEPKACSICKPLDGKRFKVDKLVPGENAAPMHPFCRCSVAGYYKRGEGSEVTQESEIGNNNHVSNVQIGGAISKRRGDVKKQQDDFAERYYNQLRHSKRKNIINRMSASSGVDRDVVSVALTHILDNTYTLWDSEELEYRERNFYPHYDMAQSFQRLMLGNPKKSDIIMLKHESLESFYMNTHRMSYDDAHRLANIKYNYKDAVNDAED